MACRPPPPASWQSFAALRPAFLSYLTQSDTASSSQPEAALNHYRSAGPLCAGPAQQRPPAPILVKQAEIAPLPYTRLVPISPPFVFLTNIDDRGIRDASRQALVSTVSRGPLSQACPVQSPRTPGAEAVKSKLITSLTGVKCAEKAITLSATIAQGLSDDPNMM